MRVRYGAVLLGVLVFTGVPAAQAPAPTPKPFATLNQLMKGVLFPNSNVIFEVQDQDPAKIEKDPLGSASTSLSAGIYGGWPAVENAALALSEASNLIVLLGRRCDNGRLAPVENADWMAAAQQLADVGLSTYKAAQARDMAAFLDISDQLVNACAACHDVYRDRIVDGKPLGMAGRCDK